MFIKKYGVFLVSLMMVVSACSSVDSGVDVDSSASSSMGLNLSAEVDKELWTVTLPWDRYTMTDEQRIILVSAESFGLAECTRENMQDVAWTATLPEALKGVNPHVFMEFGSGLKKWHSNMVFRQPNSQMYRSMVAILWLRAKNNVIEKEKGCRAMLRFQSET